MFEKVEAFYRPDSVRSALRLLQNGKGQARVVAGGTDLIVDPGDSPRVLIDITRAGLNYIRRTPTTWTIGATTTMSEIEGCDIMPRLAGGLLARVARTCGSVQVRNLATIGGNLVHGSPAADLATPLLVLDASVVIATAQGRRKIKLPDYLTGAGRNPKSLLVEIVIPDPPRGKNVRWSFQKLGRTAVDIAIASVAVGMQLDPRGRVKWVRIALGSVSPAPMRATAAEEMMTGHFFDSALVTQISEQVACDVSPISDARATADYRREMCAVLTRRALRECAGQTEVTQ